MPTAADLILRGRILTERLAELANRWDCDVPDCDGLAHEGWLHRHARAAQREPDDYSTWLIQAGRGSGKSRTGAETSKKWGLKRRVHIPVIARTDRECRNICFEGPSGLLSVIRPQLIANYHKSVGDTYLSLTNGTTFRAFSSEQAEALRGYAFDSAWVDEFGAWAPSAAQEVWDNLWFALREAKDPRVIVTTTPRALPHVKMVMAEATVITRGSIFDNAANLSPKALAILKAKYEGTRLGRQELHGELLEDVEGALWAYDMIARNRFIDLRDGESEEDLCERLGLWRIIVGVDPAGTKAKTSDETGIVTVGVGGPRVRPEYYILDDVSGKYSPDEWAKQAVLMHDKWGADAIAAEQNNGWEMVNATLRHQDSRVAVRKMVATRGKHLRAEPIVALYEQNRVHHVGVFPALEDQMTSWVPFDSAFSPDRLDALVWACTELSTGPSTKGSFGGSAMASQSLGNRQYG